MVYITLPVNNNDSDSETNSESDNSQIDSIDATISYAVAKRIILDEKVIILSNFGSTTENLQDSFSIDSYEYELVYFASTYNEHNGLFKGDIFSWHGGSFSKWWYQDCHDKITL